MTPDPPKPALFRPKVVGNAQLQHRVVFAPATRLRATKEHVPVVPLVKTYYNQRSRVPGTLIITEATFIADEAGGSGNVPGIYTDEQVLAWKEITDAVHENGSFIFLQLWALGRSATPSVLQEEGGFPYVAPSPIPLSTSPADWPLPQELSIAAIERYTGLYVKAAKRAVEEAGFDGVEVHGANGYLIDQFFQDVTNTRDDEYGGSIQNRSRFGLRVVDAVVAAVGPERTGLRLSPWSTYQDMKMEDPIPQFQHIVESLAKSHPTLAYLHFVEPDQDRLAVGDSNDAFRKIWYPRTFITCGGYTRERALQVAEEHGDLIAFAQKFIANPDLPFRLEKDLPFNDCDYSGFYVPFSPKGYIDYPFTDEFPYKL